MKSAYHFIAHIIASKSVIFELAKRDIQQKYMGSYLGFVWVFLQPLLFIIVIYMVFTYGFRAGVVSQVPFSVHLVTGIIAWLFFAENLQATTNSIKEYSFLVKRVDFRLSVLPIVKLISSMLPHVFLIFIAIGLAWHEGYPPSAYLLQLLYYQFAMFVLLLALGWITSSTYLFVKDVNNIVILIVQFGFWLTPIFWDINLIPHDFVWLLNLNPMYYIVSGYRDSLALGVGFWERPFDTLIFWTITLFLLFLGVTVFKRLRPHFAEVI